MSEVAGIFQGVPLWRHHRVWGVGCGVWGGRASVGERDQSPYQRAQSQWPLKVQGQVCLVTANPGASFKTCPGGRGVGSGKVDPICLLTMGSCENLPSPAIRELS